MTYTNINEQLRDAHEQEAPSMGDIYRAYSTIQQLDSTEPWAFGDKIRRREMKQTAKAVLDLAGTQRAEQVIADTHEWLAGKDEVQNC